MDGHPWEQVPSGSTMHPSEQQAGDVASHIALRAKASKLSGVSEKPSFSKASVVVIRYGLRCVVFIRLKGHQLPAEPTGYPMDSPENSSDQSGHVHEVTSTLSVWWNVDALESTPSTGT